MANENNLKKYVEYLNTKRKNPEYVPTNEDKSMIQGLYNDSSIKDIITQINNTYDYSKQMGIVNRYALEEEIKKNKDEKELISKIYGISVKNVENIQLENGVNAFTFYDEKLGRKRIIQNIGKDTLIKQLKESSNNNELYQTDNYQKNSENILKDAAYNNSNRQEFNMVPIDEYIANPENYGVLTSDTNLIVRKLMSLKDEHEIKYFNIDNMVVLTKKNDVLELVKDENGDYKLNTPSSFKNSVNEISNEDKVNDSLKYNSKEESDLSIENNDFEENVEFVTGEDIEKEIKNQNINIKENVNEIKQKIEYYYNNPEKIIEIEDEEEKNFYEKMVNEVYAVRKANYIKSKSMSLAYTNNDYGYVNLLLIAIALIILVFVIYSL